MTITKIKRTKNKISIQLFQANHLINLFVIKERHVKCKKVYLEVGFLVATFVGLDVGFVGFCVTCDGGVSVGYILGGGKVGERVGYSVGTPSVGNGVGSPSM